MELVEVLCFKQTLDNLEGPFSIVSRNGRDDVTRGRDGHVVQQRWSCSCCLAEMVASTSKIRTTELKEIKDIDSINMHNTTLLSAILQEDLAALEKDYEEVGAEGVKDDGDEGDEY
ncbi:hypothetical protein LguiB_034120 [Lonicera macranthoides]